MDSGGKKINVPDDLKESYNLHAQRVGAVVVTFRPDLEALRNLLKALAPQVRMICLVDNGSESHAVSALKEMAEADRIKLVLLGSNHGIAVAQNAGIDRVARDHTEFVVLFDQDSVPAADMIDRLVDTHDSYVAEGKRIAAIGPISVDARTGTRGKFVLIRRGRVRQVQCAPDRVIEVDFLIASGSLIPLKAIDAVGPMNSGYFIDHVDTEWCLRARVAGWRMYGVGAARLEHALGDRVIRVWFFRWREVSVHSPLRDYYTLRNATAMVLHSQMSWSWRVAYFNRLIQYFVFFGLAVPPRGRRIGMMLRGIWHGVINRMGSY